MNKSELLALGLPEESVREFQKLYNRDLLRMARRMAVNKEPDDLRKAIISTLSTIEDPERLRAILANVTHHYLKDYRVREDAKKAAQGATNTQDGEAEQKVSETQCSASSLAEGEEGSQA